MLCAIQLSGTGFGEVLYLYFGEEEQQSEQSEVSSTLVVWIDVKERKNYFNHILSV